MALQGQLAEVWSFPQKQTGRLADRAKDGVADLRQRSGLPVGGDHRSQVHAQDSITLKAATLNLSLGALQRRQ